MDRALALEKLKGTFELKKDNTQRQYELILQKHKVQLTQKLLEAVLQLRKHYPIRVLQFQLMRTDLYQDKYRIEVCGYNKNWYLDEERTTAYVDIAYLFMPFQKLKQELEQGISVYMGAVSLYDINNMVNEFFISCFNHSAMQMREGFYLFDEWLLSNSRTYRKPYRVMWGEYRGRVDVLYLQDEYGKEAQDLIKVCEHDKKAGHQFLSSVHSNLKDMRLKGEKFAYLNVKKSSMQYVEFEHCQFGESMFQESVMDWCSYNGSTFYGCNFSRIKGYQLGFANTVITNSSFEGINLRRGNFQGARLVAVDFGKSNLSECNFRNTTLSMVDLRAESLEGIDLTDARMEEVYINEKDMELLHLTEQQKENVYVLKEAYGDKIS